jgi:hypothetical protein
MAFRIRPAARYITMMRASPALYLPALRLVATAALLSVTIPQAVLQAKEIPPVETPAFEDPVMKGSLIASDYPSIPSGYHGYWADSLKNCHATSDRGQQLVISAIAIGFDAVLKVESYSDHPAIIVSLAPQEGAASKAFLDMALDGKYISIQSDHWAAPAILIRCPPPTESVFLGNESDAGWGDQVRQARASNDFPLFLEAFLASHWVQRESLAPRIRVITSARSRHIRSHQYLRAPLRYVDDHYALNDENKSPVRVKIDIVPLGDDRFRVNWIRATYSDPVDGLTDATPLETYGPPGWLVFERDRHRSWQLVEDGVD